MSLNHWRWSLHANINEAPSFIIKTDGVSLTEQLFATPLEDKDHQGRTRVYISNEHQFINQDPTKIKNDWWEKIIQPPISSSPRLDSPKKSRMQRRDLCSMDIESRALSNRFKNRWWIVSKDMELQHTLRFDSTLTLGFKWRATARLKLGGERPSIPLKDDPTMLFLLPSPCRSSKLVCNPSTHNYFLSISLNVSIDICKST
jgi:hypothetical protein